MELKRENLEKIKEEREERKKPSDVVRIRKNEIIINLEYKIPSYGSVVPVI